LEIEYKELSVYIKEFAETMDEKEVKEYFQALSDFQQLDHDFDGKIDRKDFEIFYEKHEQNKIKKKKEEEEEKERKEKEKKINKKIINILTLPDKENLKYLFVDLDYYDVDGYQKLSKIFLDYYDSLSLIYFFKN
jgi:hypothetical protein